MAGLQSAGFRSWGLRNSLTDLSAQSALVPGAVAVWDMTALSPDGLSVYDLSGNGYHGTLGVGAAKPTAGITGLSFDGGDTIAAAVTPDGTAAGITATIVVNVTADTYQYFLSKQSGIGATGTGWAIRKTDAVNTYNSYVFDGAGNRQIGPATALHANGTWGAITLAVTGTKAYLYSGGAIASDDDVTGITYAPAQELTIGKASYTTSGYLTGGVAYAVVYPFALTTGQIAQNYAYLKAKLAPRGVALP
jgi:hypothetical protein